MENNTDKDRTFGPEYSKEHDEVRIKKQHEVIRDLMLDGQKRTLDEIAQQTGFPTPSISAQLRHLRKARFGSYDIQKRRLEPKSMGLYVYWIANPTLPIDGAKQ